MLTSRQVRLVETLQKQKAQPVDGVENVLPARMNSPEIPLLTGIQQRHVRSLTKYKVKVDPAAPDAPTDDKGGSDEDKGKSRTGDPRDGDPRDGDPRDYYSTRRREVARQQEEMPTIGGGDDTEEENYDEVEDGEEGGTMLAPPAGTVDEEQGHAEPELSVILNEDDSYTYNNGVSIDPARYRPIYQRANHALFDYLDEFHVNVEDTGDETFQYNASDVTVVNKMEVPVPINIANSEIKFEFKTQEGDIGFGVVFASYADPAEDDEGGQGNTASNRDPMEFNTLYAERIMQSDVHDEPIKGKFTVDEAGVLFFLFNNEHEWVADKHVSYQIDVLSPAFTEPDYERCAISLPLLDDCLGDLAAARSRHVDAVNYIDKYSTSVQDLEGAIRELEADMEGLHAEWGEASEKLSHATRTLSRCNEVKPGLCIRTLQKRELYYLLTYAPEEASQVCKYWSDLVCNHGLNYSDRSHLLDSSPRRRRISANNRETAALPMPGKPVAPKRRYPGLVSGIGSISGHGTGLASIGTGGASAKGMSSHGGAAGVTGDSLRWASDDDDEYDKEQQRASRASPTLREKQYGADDFRSVYAYSETLTPDAGKDTGPRKPTPVPAPLPASASTEHLSPRGYKPEDYASLYGAPATSPASFSAKASAMADPIPRPTPSAPRAEPSAVTAKGATDQKDDRIVVTNARAKAPSPSPAHTYHYQDKGKAKQEPTATAGGAAAARGEKQHDDNDGEDSLDGVGTPAKPVMKSVGGRRDARPLKKPDPAQVVRQVDECFAQDEVFEAQRAALKQKLSVWCQIFEEKRRRPPTVKEKRRLTKDLYASYQETRVQQARNFEQVNELLGSIGMSLHEYQMLGEPEE